MESRMTFGDAVEALKVGKKVARKGWNGKGMYLYLADGKLLTQEIGDGSYPFTDSVVMKTADNRYCIGWLASQTDMLAGLAHCRVITAPTTGKNWRRDGNQEQTSLWVRRSYIVQ